MIPVNPIVPIIKPWGKEELLEYNDFYVVKRLFMKEGHSCSLQYHDQKHETIYVISGELEITIGDDILNLRQISLFHNDYYVIPPKKIHRMRGVTDCVYLESSTTELNDVIRLKDDYGRK